MNSYSLPHGAKGIETEDFAMALGADKLVFILKSRAVGQPARRETEIHYTLQGGARSGVLDLHETRTAPDGQKSHQTLFALRTGDLPHLLQQLAPMVIDLLGLVRPLRLGWMARSGIGVARGVDPISDLDLAAVTRKRKRRLNPDPFLYEQNIFVPKYLDQVYEFPDGQFTLFDERRKIGFGFKATDETGHIRLFWIKRRDILRFGNTWQRKIIDALRAAAIPPEQYTNYPFLCP